ncbi:hypothetical protein F5J12DRAFT_206031 [Pisolithus orientalis]|uniref:uncharacterized protein n=1 Tax=Pisolithus orientalis TaxID=936130 RepID=UPI0022243BF3|nr:uncharacterized protein F5J12DRAFT_206031 [Pisolithus orientalis]KAI6002578.1 hypothetical protein F5J12DRAFT_206031 [Pisolithus orientalis]
MAPCSLRSWWRSLRGSQPPSGNVGVIFPTEATSSGAPDAIVPTRASDDCLDPTEAKKQIDRIPSQAPSGNAVISTRASDDRLDPAEAKKQIDRIHSQTLNRNAGILLPTEATSSVAPDAVVPTQVSDYRLDPTEAKKQIDRIPSQTLSRNAGILLPTEATSSVAPDAAVSTQVSDYRLGPTQAKRRIDHIPRFRILVMGRANAGKTTVLQRVCNTTDQPEIFDGNGEKVDTGAVEGSLGRGYHNIEDELVFKSNPRFVFHDSCGFEAGSEAEFDEMKKFVIDQAKSTKLEKRIHAIWYCIPLNERHRMVTAAERKFFNECDSGHVPVIVLLTKADTLYLDAFQELRRSGLTGDDAKKKVPEVERQLQKSCLEKIKGWLNALKFPPQSYLMLTGMEQESADCEELLRCTANTLTEEGLQGLLISSQQSNLGLCMEFAIMETLKRAMIKVVDQNLGSLQYELASWFPFVVCEILQD